MNKKFIAVSYLGVDKENQFYIDNKLKSYDNFWAHVDIMDGMFVENKSFETKEKYEELISNLNPKVIDVHIMVKDIKYYIDMLINSCYKPDYITFHFEALKDIDELIKYSNYLHDNNIKCGVSIKPDTNEFKVVDYLEYIDELLVMSVEPGKGGQSFIENTHKKLLILNDYKQEFGFNYLIEVDGGINDSNIKLVSKNADVMVVGSYLTKHIDELNERIEKLEHEIQ